LRVSLPLLAFLALFCPKTALLIQLLTSMN
jgi:hypothetical protein